MDVAIIGLAQSGKSTVFNAMTRGHGAATGGGGAGAETHVGVVKVPDPRLTTLAEMYQRKKVVYAEIKYWDLPGPDAPTQSHGIGGRNRNILQGADALLIVLRAFTNPAVHHPLGGVDPSRDLAVMLDELALADLEVIERAVERQEDGIKKCKPAERPALVRQLETVRKVKQGLEEGIPLRLQELTSSESEILAAYQFLTSKPVIVVFNTDEAGPEPTLGQLGLNPAGMGALGEVNMCGKLEADLALMSDEEEQEFREELGVGEQAMSKVIRVSYETLGLVSFLTIGDDEVRAWSVPAGLPAQDAAGNVHSDFYKGFIRAEVIPFDDLARCGSIAQCRKEGVLRSEGKTYLVKDGDVIDFLVNV